MQQNPSFVSYSLLSSNELVEEKWRTKLASQNSVLAKRNLKIQAAAHQSPSILKVDMNTAMSHRLNNLTSLLCLATGLLVAVPLSVHGQSVSELEVEIGNNKMVEFEIIRKSEHFAFAAVLIGKYLKLDRDVEVSPTGPLSPVLVDTKSFFSDWKLQPFSKNSFLAIESDSARNFAALNVFDQETGKRLRGKGGSFIALCEQGEPTISTCYRMSDITFTIASASSASTGNPFVDMLGKSSSSFSMESTVRKAGNSLNLIHQFNVTFSGNAPPAYVRLIDQQMKASILQNIERKRVEDDTKKRNENQIRDVRLKAEREQYMLVHSKAIKKIQDLPIGTTIFCTNSGNSLLKRGDLITTISYKCDIADEEQRFSIRELLEAGLDIVSETQTTIEAMIGVGNVVSLRLKRIKGA